MDMIAHLKIKHGQLHGNVEDVRERNWDAQAGIVAGEEREFRPL